MRSTRDIFLGVLCFLHRYQGTRKSCLAFLSPWGGVGGPSLPFLAASCCLAQPLRPWQGLKRPQPWPSSVTRMKLFGEESPWARVEEEPGEWEGAKGAQEGRASCAVGVGGDAPSAREKAMGLAPTGLGLLPLSQRERRRGGGPRAEQPGSGMPGIQVTRGCEINGSSEEPRTAWRLLSGERKRLRAGLPPPPRPSSAGSQKPAWLLPFCGAAPPKPALLQEAPILTTASNPSAQAPKGYTKGCSFPALPQHHHLHCHLNLLSTAYPTSCPPPPPNPVSVVFSHSLSRAAPARALSLP